MKSSRTEAGHHARRAVSATFWSALNTVIPILTAFCVFILVARILTPHQLGIVAFASGLALIGSALCPGGLGEAIIQRLEISEAQLSSVFWLCLASGIVVYGAECAAAPLLAKHFKMNVLAMLIPVISTRVVADMMGVVPNALLAREMSFKLMTKRTVIVSLVAAAIVATLLLAGFGIWAVVIAQVAISFISTTAGFLAIKWRPKFIFHVAALKELLGYGLFSSGTQSLAKVFQQNEQILVGLFLGATNLGFYNFSKMVLNVFNSVVAGSLGAVAHPMFSGIQNDRERVKKGFLSATFFSSLLAFPMFIGLALTMPKLVLVAFGPRWVPAVPLIQLLCLNGLTGCIGTLQSGLITSQGKANWWFYYQLLQTIGTALAIIVFARFGLVPMVLAIVIKVYVFWVIPARNSMTLLSMPAREYVSNFRTPAIGTLIMGLAVLAAGAALPDLKNFEILPLEIGLGILVYALTVLAVDAGRIQTIVHLVAPKFKKSVTTA